MVFKVGESQYEKVRRYLKNIMATPTDLDSNIAAERSRAYRGAAKVQIRHVLFEDNNQLGARPVDPKNVARLLKIYELEGCFRLEPEHHVPVLISSEALSAALRAAQLEAGSLMTCGEPPSLDLPYFPIVGLHGIHRLKAANQHLDPDDKWWVVNFYLNGRCSMTLWVLDNN